MQNEPANALLPRARRQAPLPSGVEGASDVPTIILLIILTILRRTPRRGADFGNARRSVGQLVSGNGSRAPSARILAHPEDYAKQRLGLSSKGDLLTAVQRQPQRGSYGLSIRCGRNGDFSSRRKAPPRPRFVALIWPDGYLPSALPAEHQSRLMSAACLDL